jgi:hypothetical protein
MQPARSGLGAASWTVRSRLALAMSEVNGIINAHGIAPGCLEQLQAALGEETAAIDN